MNNLSFNSGQFMFRPFSLFVGMRYATNIRKKTKFISFISSTSVIGLALGVAVLIIVMSVMNGFNQELKNKILGMIPHASINPLSVANNKDEKIIDIALKHPNVQAAAPFVEVQGLITFASQVSPSIVYGVTPELEKDVSIIVDNMLTGSIDNLTAGKFNIVIGEMMSVILGVDIGDKITLVLPDASISLAGAFPRLRRFKVVGIFSVGADIDNHLAYAHINDLANFLRLPTDKFNVRLKVDDLFAATTIADQIREQLSGAYSIQSWIQTHGTLFNAIQIEKKMVALLLFLIIAVAAFNIVSTLMMVVTHKQSDIAILRTYGATAKDIRNIFITQGALIGFIGTTLGLIIGIPCALYLTSIVSFIEQIFGVAFLNPEVYFINQLPSKIQINDIAYIALTGFFMSIFAATYPAWRAAKIHPAEALRHE